MVKDVKESIAPFPVSMLFWCAIAVAAVLLTGCAIKPVTTTRPTNVTINCDQSKQVVIPRAAPRSNDKSAKW